MGATAPAPQATAEEGGAPVARAASGEAIEANAPGELLDDDEFDASDYDATSTASTSVTSSIYHHHFENGRRVSPSLHLASSHPSLLSRRSGFPAHT